MQSILVTGANGQLARSLIETHSARVDAVKIIALDRQDLDITRPETVDAAFAAHEPDLVVNCAAYTAVDKAESEEQQAMAINAEGAHAVAKLCARNAIPLLHFSTDYVFDGEKSDPYCETDPTSPAGVYGLSKLLGEQEVEVACPEHIIVRTSWLYSPFGHNFVRTMLHLAREQETVSVVDDQLGCPTYAPHLAEAVLQITDRILAKKSSETPWGTYHAAGGGETTWFGFAQEIFHQSVRRGGPHADTHPISTSDYPTPAKRPANSRLDCSALKERFGISLPDWQTGVESCVERLLAAPSRVRPLPEKTGEPI